MHTEEDAAAVSYKLAVIRFRGDSLNKTQLSHSLTTAISVIESVCVCRQKAQQPKGKTPQAWSRIWPLLSSAAVTLPHTVRFPSCPSSPAGVRSDVVYLWQSILVHYIKPV